MTCRFHSRLAIATFVATTLLLSACGRGTDDLVASAKAFTQQQDHAAAVLQLKTALQKDPNLAEARLLLGLALLETGDLAAAAIELNKAREGGASPDDVEPARARAMLLQGNIRGVVEQFAATRLTTPTASAKLRTLVASAHAASGDRDKAREAVLAALQDWPEYVPAAVVHARLLAGDGDVSGAMRIVDAALGREPTHLSAMLLKAELQRFGLQDRVQAMQTYAQAIEAHPREVVAHAALVTMLFEQRDHEAARARFEPMKALHPQHPETLLFEAQFALLDGEPGQARDIAQRILSARPDDARVLRLAGAGEMRLGNLPQAEVHLTRAVARRPNELMQRQMLAQVFVRTGQPSKAIEVLRPILNAANPDSDSLTLAGEAMLQIGDAAQAERLFARAVRDDPNATTARTELALRRLSRGETSDGFAELEKLAATDPGVRTNLVLVAARMRANDLPGALRAIDELASKQPDVPNTHVLRARVLIQQRDLDGARASFEKALALDPLFFPATAGLAALELAAGRPEGAQRRYEDLVKRDPRNASALLGLAELKARSGAPKDEVTAAVNRAVEAAPGELAPRTALINHLLRNQDFTAALSAAQAAHATFPAATETVYLLGTAQLSAGENRQAIATLTRLASQRPDRPEFELKLAEAHFKSGDLASARQSLRRVLELSPGLRQAQLVLAQIALRENQPQEALNIARAIQRAEPKQAAGYLLEADVEAWRQRPDASSAALRKGLEAAPGTGIAIQLHRSLVNQQRRAEAARLAANWMRERPRDFAFKSHLGEMAIAARDWPEAEQHFSAILKENPNHALAMNNVAWLMLKQGKPGALALAERAAAAAPESPALLDTLAAALLAEGQTARALETQRRAVALAQQKAPEIDLNLARMLIQTGEAAEARTILARLTRLGGRFDQQDQVAKLLTELPER